MLCAPQPVTEADVQYMRLALEEARLAGAAGEVPVGAVIISRGQVIGQGGNRTRRDSIVHAHAELVALAEAERLSGDFRLDHAVLYVTLEPCLMCLGAAHQARLARIVYGAAETKFGAWGSRFDLRGHSALRRMEVIGGVLAEEAAELLSAFFRSKREGG